MILSNSNTSFQLKDNHLKDYLLKVSLILLSFIATIIIGLIIFFLLAESLPFFTNIGIDRIFSDSSWHPSEKLFNLTPILIGSLYAMLGAIIIASPLGIISAIFLNFYSIKSISIFFERIINLLAGIPSVVFGFWGLTTLVPIIQKIQNPGASLLAGILILAFMILPTITLIANSTIKNLPTKYILAANGLGLPKFTTITKVILPIAKPGLLTGIILASGRALGETMAILMVCGNIVQFPSSLFSPIRTLTANIALEMGYATGDHRSALFVTSLLLMILVTFLVLSSKILRKNEKEK